MKLLSHRRNKNEVQNSRLPWKFFRPSFYSTNLKICKLFIFILRLLLESNKNAWEVSATGRYVRTKFGYKLLSAICGSLNMLFDLIKNYEDVKWR